MNKTGFDEFVKRQQLVGPKEGQVEIDWDAQRQEWLAYLNNLYTQIESFLTDYLAAGQVEREYRQITLNEENIGTYFARQLTLKFGRQEVRFVPIGTSLIGAKGRVDVDGPAGKARLVLINKNVTNARQLIRVTVSVGTAPPPPVEQPKKPIEWAWKIASAPPQMSFADLTQETFFDMILEVVNA